MGVDMAMSTSRSRHPRSGYECAFRVRGDRRLDGLQADCCLSQTYNRTIDAPPMNICPTKPSHARLAFQRAGPGPYWVTLPDSLAPLSMFAPVWHL